MQKKESKEIKAGVIRLSDLKQPEEEVSKYSLSNMKIDAKSLLKRAPVTIPKPLKLDRTSQVVSFGWRKSVARGVNFFYDLRQPLKPF